LLRIEFAGSDLRVLRQLIEHVEFDRHGALGIGGW